MTARLRFTEYLDLDLDEEVWRCNRCDAMAALARAGLDVSDVDAITTHNPFAVNDLWFSRQTGIPLERMNAYGCSLIYGHPQGPTGARLIVELLHTLRLRGGGNGLFTGCAAGDTGAAVVVRVED